MQIINFAKFAKTYNWDEDFVSYITQNVFNFIPDSLSPKIFIAGGFWRRAILNQLGFEKGDIDLFFSDEETFLKTKELFSKFGHCTLDRENENNVVFTIKFDGDIKQSVEIQLIKIQFYPNVESLINSFDFTICQFGVCCQHLLNNKEKFDLCCGDSALFDVANKRLVINTITYPVASMRRLIKYTKQGLFACNGCLTTFLEKVVELSGQGVKLADNQYLD